MAKKRANGEGSIRKRKDGRWEARYTAGYDPTTGKRIIKSALGKTQAEVKGRLTAKIEECKQLDISRRGRVLRRTAHVVSGAGQRSAERGTGGAPLE